MSDQFNRIRPVALPVEHGGWGFLLEPIVLALLVAPSWAGLLLGCAAFLLFLARHPLRLALRDRRSGRRFARTALAERFAAGYVLGTGAAFAWALMISAESFWPPLIVGGGLALVQLFYDVRGEGRAALAEIAGALALGASAPAIALAGGWSAPDAWMLWAIVGLRAVTSIFYVRDRLRLERDRPAQPALTLMLHLLALLFVGLRAAGSQMPWLAAAAFVLLLARAAYGLSAWRQPAQPKTIGWQEMLYGLLVVLLVAAGYRLML